MPSALDFQHRGLKFSYEDGKLQVEGPSHLITEAMAESDARIPKIFPLTEMIGEVPVPVFDRDHDTSGCIYTARFSGYGRCEICGDEMASYKAGTCVLCSRAVRVALERRKAVR